SARSASLGLGLAAELAAVRVHLQTRNLAVKQFLPHVLPILDGQQVGVFLAETAARLTAHELHAVLELFGQKDGSFFEKAIRHAFLARFTVGIGANLDLRQFLDGIVIEQKYPAVAAHAVISRIQVLVEDIGGGIVANAMTEADDHLADLLLVGGLQIDRQRDDFHLHDERAS